MMKKWLNMNPKPDNKCERGGDIILLSEIITNSRYWHPLKGPCQEKTAYHRKKVQFFLQGHHPVTGLAPFLCLRP
jgi:hypothetical protein